MDIFDHLREEQHFLEEQLIILIEHYGVWTREEVFNKVKQLCDMLTGHLQEQAELLLVHLQSNQATQEMLNESNNDRSRLSEEVGQLVMVHVDEPEYTECLRALLKKLRQHDQFSDDMYKRILEHVTKLELAKINSAFEQQTFKMADFTHLHATG